MTETPDQTPFSGVQGWGIRRRICAALTIAGTLLIMAVPPAWAQDPTLVAHYPFNGNADDASGNGNDGVVVGATLTFDRFGAPSSAMSFDGIDDYIRIPDNGDSLDITEDFTIALWLRPTASSWFALNKHMSGVNGEGSWWLVDHQATFAVLTTSRSFASSTL